MAAKLLGIIFGVLMVVGGIYCMMTPQITFFTLGWVLGVCMIADSIGNIATWSTRRKLGVADGWTLAIGIISLLAGIAIVANNTMQFAVDMFIVYTSAFWVIAVGLLRIVGSVRLRGINKTREANQITSLWWVALISGILLVVVGVFGLANPAVAAVALGISIGLSIVAAGANLIATAVSA